MLLRLGPFAIELWWKVPRSAGRIVHWSYGKSRSRESSERTRRERRVGPRFMVQLGPVDLDFYYQKGPLGERDHMTRWVGDGVEALRAADRWTIAETNVLWLPGGDYCEPKLRIRAIKMNRLGTAPERFSAPLEFEAVRMENPLDQVHVTSPSGLQWGYPSTIKLPETGTWRFEVEIGRRTASLMVVAEPG